MEKISPEYLFTLGTGTIFMFSLLIVYWSSWHFSLWGDKLSSGDLSHRNLLLDLLPGFFWCIVLLLAGVHCVASAHAVNILLSGQMPLGGIIVGSIFALCTATVGFVGGSQAESPSLSTP